MLPLVASLPLLCAYSGPTSIVVPRQLRGLLFVADTAAGASDAAAAAARNAAAAAASGELTLPAKLLELVGIVVDTGARGAIVELGRWCVREREPGLASISRRGAAARRRRRGGGADGDRVLKRKHKRAREERDHRARTRRRRASAGESGLPPRDEREAPRGWFGDDV